VLRVDDGILLDLHLNAPGRFAQGAAESGMAPLSPDQRCSCGLAEIPVSEAVCAAPVANPLTAIAASVTRAMRANYCTYAFSDHENVNLIVRVSIELGCSS
jgi:hypothetical protein